MESRLLTNNTNVTYGVDVHDLLYVTKVNTYANKIIGVSVDKPGGSQDRWKTGDLNEAVKVAEHVGGVIAKYVRTTVVTETSEIIKPVLTEVPMS